MIEEETIPIIIGVCFMVFFVIWCALIAAKPVPKAREEAKAKSDPSRPAAVVRENRRSSGLTVGIAYAAPDGRASQREVTVQSFEQRGQTFLISGHCHLRNERRTFSMDGIRAAWIADTGEVIPDLWDYLTRSHSELFRTARSGLSAPRASDLLRILLYVGKADGRLMAPERALIAEACSAIGGEPITDNEVRAAAAAGACSAEDFEHMARKLLETDPSKLAEVVKVAERIVATQKTVHENELAALALLRHLAR